MLLEQVMNFQNGQVETINDLNGKFDVWTDIGPSYTSMRDQYRDELKELYVSLDPASQERNIVLLQYLTMLDGPATEILREYANKQLVLQGLKEPETDEEKQMVAQAQMVAQQQQDPMMIAANAEAEARIMEGRAAIMNEQNDAAKNQIDMYKAETGRIDVMTKAEKAGADINLKRVDLELKAMGQLGSLQGGM